MDNKRHIVAITAFIKNSAGDKFLILKRNKDEIAYPGKWSFPGGKIEKGQTVLETLKREVFEETGLEIYDSIEYLKDYTFIRPDGYNVVGFCFLVKAKTDDVKISKDFDYFKWILPNELKNFDYIEGMEDEVELVFRL